MTSYGPLARWYDSLTGDVPYEQFADFYEKLLKQEGKEALTLLDFCCGTGTLTGIFARRGHEMIGTDISPDMLSVAMGKGAELENAPLYLCQGAAELDLYGTVNGAYCSLDGINYIPPEELSEAFRRLHLFIEPGGILAFDFHSPEHLRSLDGEMMVDEDDELLCLWRAEFDEEENAIVYGMDIFRLEEGGLWLREQEEHVEYAHGPQFLKELLSENGFADIELITDGPQHEMGRLFIRCKNLPH